MSISDIFDSGFKRRNQDHFAAIVRVAMSDDVINDSEREFLDRLARKLEISDEKYKEILKDYKTHPINPPLSYEKRLERLYDLARMVWADHSEERKQIKILRKLCIGLGFNAKNAKYIADKAMDLVHEDADLDQFMVGIKTMNE
jgi:uncharacterized tellurite resistance protein B-like protein